SLISTHTATTKAHPLSLHDALPILKGQRLAIRQHQPAVQALPLALAQTQLHVGQRQWLLIARLHQQAAGGQRQALQASGLLEQTDRKSTRLNSSHVKISYAVICLKK